LSGDPSPIRLQTPLVRKCQAAISFDVGHAISSS
jgi:hypothetical protein